MTDTAAKSGGKMSSLGKAVMDNPVAKRLLDEAKKYAQARSADLVKSLEGKLGGIAEKAQGGGAAGAGAAKGAEKLAQGESPARAGLSAVTAGAKEKGKSLFGGGGDDKGGGGDGSPKMTNIIETIDIGMPLSVVYNQWTQYPEFAKFAKGVESVDWDPEEVESTWRLKVAWSRRIHKATTLEQVPDRRIQWKSDSDKGSTKGVVTFHPLADDLTRVLLNIEYFPGGFFEKTANLWRAPGRRARLDLKHFRRFIMANGEETGAWRGEIRDGEIVKQPEDSEDESGGDEGEQKPQSEDENQDQTEDQGQDDQGKDEQEDQQEDQGEKQPAEAGQG